MSGYLDEVRSLKARAEAKNSTGAFNCLDNQLETIKGSLKTAEVSQVELRSALAEKNRVMAERQLQQIVSVAARAKKAYSQALTPRCSEGIGAGGIGSGGHMTVTVDGKEVEPEELATGGSTGAGGGEAAVEDGEGSVVGSDNLAGEDVDDSGESDIVPEFGSNNG
jgi:hypothetical protein